MAAMETLTSRDIINTMMRAFPDEAMQKIADGQATKLIPSEMQGLAGLANGIAEGTKK